MFGQADYSLTDSYYREFYDEWLRRVSRWRRWQLPVAMVAGIAAIASWLFEVHVLTVLLAIFGAVQAADAFLNRRKWLADRRNSSRLGETIKIRFSHDAVEFSGPVASGTLAWAGVKSWSVTERGIFLRPDTGVLIYVPKNSIWPPDALDQILNCLERAQDTESAIRE